MLSQHDDDREIALLQTGILVFISNASILHVLPLKFLYRCSLIGNLSPVFRLKETIPAWSLKINVPAIYSTEQCSNSAFGRMSCSLHSVGLKGGFDPQFFVFL